MKRISKLFDVSVPDPEDARRRRLLNVLLVYVGACAFLCAILLIVIPAVLVNDSKQVAQGFFLSTVIAVIMPVLYFLNRRYSGRLAELMFVFILLVIILLIYDPAQNLSERGLLLFSVPIFLSSLLLRSWASFPVAAFSGLALAGLSYQTGRPLPSLLSFIDFFFLASVAWLSARGLERAATRAGLADDELRTSENRFRNVLDSMLEGCQIIGFDWKYRYINDSAAKHGQRPKNELLGRTIMEAYPGIEQTEMFAALRKCMDKREPQEMVNEFIYPDGSKASFELGFQPVPEGVFILSLEITDRKRAEEEIARLAKFPSENPNPVLRLARNGTILYANDASKTLLAEWGSAIGRPAPRYWQEIAAESLEKKANNIVEAQSGGRTYSVFVTPIVGEDYVNLYVRDESERKRAEEALRESEDKFKYVFDNSVVGKSITLLSGEMHANKAFCELLGYPPEELQSKRWQEITHPEDIELTQKEIDALLSGEKEAARFAKRYLHRNGSVVWVDVSTSLRRDEQSKPLYLMTTLVDITERKRAEEALQKSEKRLREAQEMAHLGFWTWDVKTGAVEWSEEVFKIFRLDPKEFTPQIDSILTLSPWPEDHQRDQELIQRAIETRSPGSYEQKFLRPDKSIGHYYSTFQGNYDEKGDLISIVGTVLDITERKRAEEALRESEDKFKYVFDNSVVGKSITLLSGDMHANKAFCEMLGYSLEELQNKRWQEITHPDDIEATQREVDTLNSGEKEAARFTKRYFHKNGSIVWTDVSTSLRRDKQGEPLYLMTTLVDITARMQAEEALKNTLADLERSNMDLEQFAYVASHDLQEPLRMVSSYTQLLARRYKGKLDKDADEFIGYAVEGADNMQRLINDLLSYSRVGTRGKPPSPVPADSALDRALENLKLVLKESQVEVKREPLPTVTVDDVQLIQVFQNLIANAIKFHGDEPPRINISCEARGSEWVFSVRDNGIGIDPQYLERIFIIFQRLHKRGQYPGTGIGLAMCKKIIVRHGGRIWVESEPGKGSTFYFSLPKTGG